MCWFGTVLFFVAVLGKGDVTVLGEYMCCNDGCGVSELKGKDVFMSFT